jgi:NADH dehydrogenase
MGNGRITVFGGSGFIGRHLAARLAARGAAVRVAVRHPDRLASSGPSGHAVEAVQADVLDVHAVAAATKDADVVFNLVGILTETDAQSYAGIHVEGARNVALAALGAGTARLVHVSALGARQDAPALSDRTKAAGEIAVWEAFPAATILRPSLVFGEDDHFFNGFAALARRSPWLPLIGGGVTRFQPLHVDDMAEALATAAEGVDAAGETYEVGGPEVYSFKELLQLLLSAIGRRRVLLPLPFALAEILAAGLELLPKPPLTRDQVQLLKTDKVVSGLTPTIAALGVRPRSVHTVLADLGNKWR